MLGGLCYLMLSTRRQVSMFALVCSVILSRLLIELMEIYYKREDIEELTSMFKDMLGKSTNEEREPFVKEFQSHFVAQDDFKAGEEKVIGFLVGQVMKESHGKANPSAVQEILRKNLS